MYSIRMVRVSIGERRQSTEWEVDGHWHFVTIHCHQSLPTAAKLELQELDQALAALDIKSEGFRQLQQRYLVNLEKHLDVGSSFAPFKQKRACEMCMMAFAMMQDEGWLVGEATIMPNHVHLLIYRQNSAYSLTQILSRFKGRSTRWVNQGLKQAIQLWQDDWFDRRIHQNNERAEVVAYIRNNPVKVGLVSEWSQHRWRISGDA